MDRALPEFNRLIVQRQMQVNKAHHHIKLRTVTAHINNSLPVSLQHPLNKKNKEMMVEGRKSLNVNFYRTMLRNRKIEPSFTCQNE